MARSIDYSVGVGANCNQNNGYFYLTFGQESASNRFEICRSKNMIELASRSIPENTKKKAMWAYRMFEAWRNWRGENCKDEMELCLVDSILLIYESDVHKMPVVDLNEVLSQFIAKVRKDG